MICSFYLYMFGIYVSYGFPIINFYNSGYILKRPVYKENMYYGNITKYFTITDKKVNYERTWRPLTTCLNTAIQHTHTVLNNLNPTDHVMHHQQFNSQQLYALPTLYLCVLYLSENKQRLVPLTA
jgi:hypothetical protein